MYARQEKFLNLRAMGYTVLEACAEVGINRKTYEKWRQRLEYFKIASDEIRVAKAAAASGTIRSDDFAGFRLRYFKHQSPPFHLKIISILEKSKPGSVTMILVPPNHGKTTLLTDWINWKLAYDPNHRILYVSESSKLAEKVIGRIKRRMSDPNVARIYISEFGPFYEPGQEKQSKPWAAGQITVFRSDHDEQDYSLEAMGWANQIYGVRSDTIVLDDYQTLRTAEKGNMTQAMVDKFQQDIYTRIDPAAGRVVILGTRVAPKDFYVNLLEQGDVVDNVIILPVYDFRGDPLWPDRLGKERLEMIKKKVGSKVWSRAYLMKPQEDGSATFTEPVLNDCKNMSLKLAEPAAVNEEAWAGIDPAIDGFTAMTTAAISVPRMRLMTTEHRFQLATGEAILALIKETWTKTKFTTLIVEAVSFQKALARDERLEAMRRECGFTIIEHTTASNKQDQTFGVARMASSFIDQTIEIPWAGEDEQHMFAPLLDELTQWRATIPTRLRVQDMVMSLWFMWMRWQKMRQSHIQPAAKSIRTQPMPFTPTQHRNMFEYKGSILGGKR
jgi:hypothetical protein